jgi:hypothetical protein
VLLSHLPHGPPVPVQIFAIPFGIALEVAPAERPFGASPSAPLLPQVLEPAPLVPRYTPTAFQHHQPRRHWPRLARLLLEPHPEIPSPTTKIPAASNLFFGHERSNVAIERSARDITSREEPASCGVAQLLRTEPSNDVEPNAEAVGHATQRRLLLRGQGEETAFPASARYIYGGQWGGDDANACGASNGLRACRLPGL